MYNSLVLIYLPYLIGTFVYKTLEIYAICKIRGFDLYNA